MTYQLNQVNTIAGKQLILLLDHYATLDKSPNYFQTVSVSENSALYVPQEELATIKSKDSTTPCYGIWQLLYHSRQINFDPQEQLLVLYNDDQDNQNDQHNNGIFLYYAHAKKNYRSGLIVNGQFIGLFGIDLPVAVAVDVDKNKLVSELSDEILRPLDRYKKEQSLLKSVVLYGLGTTAAVAGTLFLLLSIVLPNLFALIFVEQAVEAKKIQSLQRQVQQSKINLARLEQRHVPTSLNATQPESLNAILVLSVLGVNFDLATTMDAKSGQLTFNQLEPWMSQLPDDLFKISQHETKILISWDNQ